MGRLICTILILAALILYVLIRYVFPSFRIIDPPEDAVVPEVTPHEEYVISTAVPEIVKAGKKDYNIYGWEADKAIEIRMDVFSDYLMSLELVDGKGDVVFPGFYGQNGYGNDSAEYLYPYLETIPDELYLAPINDDGKGDLSQAVLVKGAD